jgi:hypothetical protein
VPGCLQSLLEPEHGRARHTLVDKAMTKHVTALKIARGGGGRYRDIKGWPAL